MADLAQLILYDTDSGQNPNPNPYLNQDLSQNRYHFGRLIQNRLNPKLVEPELV